MPDKEKDQDKSSPLSGVEMIPSTTHKYTPKCGLDLFITENIKTGEIIEITAGKAGSCKSILWEVIARLLNEIKPSKIVEIMANYNCEHGGLGGQSCCDKIARMYRARLPEQKEKNK